MATIQNQADTILQATSPRLLSNPLNYISIIPTTNTVTSTSGTLTPSTVTVKAILNGSLRGTITWSTSPSITTTPITGGIVINSTDIPNGTSVLVTATLNYAGNVYTATTNITRKQAISLSSSGVLTGEGGGSITSLDYGNVSGTKPPATATSNFFSTSTSDPSGGSDGDAHYNSSTQVMWFKVGGVWQQGGTINASQITVGTLAAARIAASSIDATKLNVSSLSAITANLGSVTAGSITGTANINITGQGIFKGSGTDGGYTASILANSGFSSTNGVVAWSSSTSGSSAVHGIALANSTYGVHGLTAIGTGSVGVRGSSSNSLAFGVVAANTAGGVALSVQGNMTITSTTLVSNLNADMVDGLHASKFVRTDTSSTITGDINITGNLQTNTLRINQTPWTGTATATFPGNNKPGSTTSCQWLAISCNGVLKYIPVWG